jgi:DNA polymerase-3 subunit delta
VQLRAEQLTQALGRGLAPLYVVHGDEPLLAQEAADAIRAAARADGYGERQVHTVAGAHFDWSGVLGGAAELSLFANRQLVEIRIPSGKPGKDGSDALQRYAARLPEDTLTLVTLPKLDFTQLKSAWFSALDDAGVIVRVDPVDRRQLPQWLAQRLAAQGQRVEDGEAGQATLAFFADRVEGNLLAAHQELAKLGLLHPAGVLSFEQVQQAVLDVARYDVFKLGEAVLGGDLARALRMLDGLAAEGEAAVLVHWTLADDLRLLRRVHQALMAGRPLPMALRESRVWGTKEKLVERLGDRLRDPAASARLDALVLGAQVCDGIVKGLREPEWPSEPWLALRRLVLMALRFTRPGRAGGGAEKRAAGAAPSQRAPGRPA